MNIKNFLAVFTLLLSTPSLFGQKNVSDIGSKSIPDKPVSITQRQMKTLDSLIAPYVAQAHKTLPKVKKRFTHGLQPGETFFLTIRLYDTLGHFEQVFVHVKTWDKDNITGTIADDINTVVGYHNGELVSFKENDILDWCITKLDGSEEGNYVGNFLDSLHKQ